MSARLHVVGRKSGRSWDYVDAVRGEIARWTSIDPQLRYDLHAKLGQAELGGLRMDEDVKHPLDTAPELGEIRLIQDRRRHFRLYFAEPAEDPYCLVALLFHRKDIEAADVRSGQDAQIALAVQRYSKWKGAALRGWTP